MFANPALYFQQDNHILFIDKFISENKKDRLNACPFRFACQLSFSRVRQRAVEKLKNA